MKDFFIRSAIFCELLVIILLVQKSPYYPMGNYLFRIGFGVVLAIVGYAFYRIVEEETK